MPLFRRELRVGRPPTEEATERLQAFASAVRAGIGFGMVGRLVQGTLTDAAIGVDWSNDGVVAVFVDTDVVALSQFDGDLVVRGVANCLDMVGFDIASGPPAAPDRTTLYAEELQRQRRTLASAVVEDIDWRYDEPFHVLLEFSSPVDRAVVANLATALMAFEKLVWGMYPLPGDVFADVGETSVAQLEANEIRLWMDSLFALPEDWKRRFEAMFIVQRGHQVPREIRYEP